VTEVNRQERISQRGAGQEKLKCYASDRVGSSIFVGVTKSGECNSNRGSLVMSLLREVLLFSNFY
jgi:hypothetical protein